MTLFDGVGTTLVIHLLLVYLLAAAQAIRYGDEYWKCMVHQHIWGVVRMVTNIVLFVMVRAMYTRLGFWSVVMFTVIESCIIAFITKKIVELKLEVRR